MLNHRVKFNDFREMAHRTLYFSGQAVYIIADYWYSFRKLEFGTPEREEMEHIVNLRSAERIFKMAE